MSAHDWIKQAMSHDLAGLEEGIKHLFNCREVEISEDGAVWIMDPQRGHWLDEDGLTRIATALKFGDI